MGNSRNIKQEDELPELEKREQSEIDFLNNRI